MLSNRHVQQQTTERPNLVMIMDVTAVATYASGIFMRSLDHWLPVEHAL
jgi:hypothetical protein